MDITLETLAILFFVSLVAETYGVIFGGGGFLTQPVMLALGIPPHMVVANDMAATTATSISGGYVFNKKGFTDFSIVKWWLPGVCIGPIIGAYLLVNTPAWVVEKLIAVFCISGSAYILFFRKKFLNRKGGNLPKKWRPLSIVLGFIYGIYNGFSGAGGGILGGLMLYTMLHLNLHKTMGTQKLINIPMMLIGAASYFWLGLIYWPILVTMFSANMIAGTIGSHIAVRVSERVLQPIFFSVVLFMAVWILI